MALKVLSHILVQQIFKLLSFKSKLYFRCTNKLYHTKLQITDLYDIEEVYLDKLDNNILKLYPYESID